MNSFRQDSIEHAPPLERYRYQYHGNNQSYLKQYTNLMAHNYFCKSLVNNIHVHMAMLYNKYYLINTELKFPMVSWCVLCITAILYLFIFWLIINAEMKLHMYYLRLRKHYLCCDLILNCVPQY